VAQSFRTRTSLRRLHRRAREELVKIVRIVDGIRWRFVEAEKFFGKAAEERYHSALENRDRLRKTMPMGNAEALRKWQKDVETNQQKIESFETWIKEIEATLRQELAEDFTFKLPRTFDQYAGCHRLTVAYEKPVTKKKILEMGCIGEDIGEWPYLYARLQEKIVLFDALEELTMVPRILEIAQEDIGRPMEELVEDDAYIADLAELLMNNNPNGLRDWIEGYRAVRKIEKKPRLKKEKQKQRNDQKTKTGLLPIYQNGHDLFVGFELILDGDVTVLIARNEDMRKAFKE